MSPRAPEKPPPLPGAGARRGPSAAAPPPPATSAPDLDLDPFHVEPGVAPAGAAADSRREPGRVQLPPAALDWLLEQPAPRPPIADIELQARTASPPGDVTERVQLDEATQVQMPHAPGEVLAAAAAEAPPPRSAGADEGATVLTSPVTHAAPGPGPFSAPGAAAEARPPPRSRGSSSRTPAAPSRLRSAVESGLSLAALVALASALFLAWRAGAATGLAARLFGRPIAGGVPPSLRVTARGGAYDTDSGAPVLVVRGRVHAREAVASPVRVRVEILEGGRVLARAEVLAGAAPSPEEVHAASTPEALLALRRALDAGAAPRLEAGEGAPFAVVLAPPAPEGHRLQLRASAEASPEAR